MPNLLGRCGPAAHGSAEAWLGSPLATDPAPERLVLRYLAAFGPASVMDVQTWCGLTRLTEVVDRLRSERLVTFRDEQRRELFDLPDAPRPDPDVPAPPRFLYDFDNLLLSHADRSRFIADERFQQEFNAGGSTPQAVLVDGVVAGTWRLSRQGEAAILTIRPFDRLPERDEAALAEEGRRLLEFLAPAAQARDMAYLT